MKNIFISREKLFKNLNNCHIQMACFFRDVECLFNCKACARVSVYGCGYGCVEVCFGEKKSGKELMGKLPSR